jgi:predicted butyrate kinase (DUF1464 family)
MPLRVVGCDPGTSSLDLLLLVDGDVADQARLTPGPALPHRLLAQLQHWAPLDLIAGPSGYGMPLRAASAVSESDLDAMSLVRPDERGQSVGIGGFRAMLRALIASGLPVRFLPGGIHLPSVPAHRKANTIDLGTPDKLAVAALALHAHRGQPHKAPSFAVIEVGSAFTAILVIDQGALVDACAGSRGPIGLRSAGSLDGEAAYALGPLSKADLFRGGVADLGPIGPAAFCESLRKTVAGLQAVTPFAHAWLSGIGLEGVGVAEWVASALTGLVETTPLPSLPGAWAKQAAQGAALLADGLAGGRHATLVDSLRLREASGTVWDHLHLRPDLPRPLW